MSVVRIDNAKNFSLTPKTLEEAMKYAEIIANSDFCPKESRGKPGNVLIAIQYGAELGLSPMQALQNISVINGRPCLWGDALLGLVKAHPSFIDIHEDIKNDIAYCKVERRNAEPVEVKFGIEDAKKAGLWGKQGPWTNYPKRMLQMRARSFALRDAFADVLKGLNMREEVEDYAVNKPKTSKHINVVVKKEEPKKLECDDNLDEMEFKADINNINDARSLGDLENVYKNAYKFWVEKRDKERLRKIIDAKDEKKKSLEDVKSFNDEIESAEVEDVKQ